MARSAREEQGEEPAQRRLLLETSCRIDSANDIVGHFERRNVGVCLCIKEDVVVDPQTNLSRETQE